MSSTNVETLKAAHANFKDMDYDVNPAKEVVKKVAKQMFPNDKFDMLKMSAIGDGVVYMPQIGNQNTNYSYVIDNNGKGFRVETEAECVGFAPGVTCGAYVGMMALGGECPAKIKGFLIK